MFPHGSKGLLVVLALLVAATVMMSGCAASSPAAYAAAAYAVPAQIGTPEAGTPAVGAAPTTPARAALAIDPNRTITVVGHGEVKAKPQVARTNIGIETMAPTVAEAMKQAQGNMDAVLKALKTQGVADKDIQTSNFSINFERQQPGQPMPATGVTNTTQAVAGLYRVNNMVNVTIRDLNKVGAIIDAATNAGANNVWGINFAIDDTSALEEQARQKAVTDAQARAISLAQLNRVNVGPVVSISEVIGQQPAPYARADMGMGGGGGTPVEPGEITFTTNLQIVYAIQ